MKLTEMLLKRLPLFCLTLSVACGEDSGPTGTPEVQSVVGTWALTDSLLNFGINRPIRCISGRGTLTVVANAQGFGGSLTDETLCLTVDDTSATGEMSGLGERAGSISGTTDGNSISFEVAFCSYEGTLSGNPPNAMSGTESCFLHIGTTDSIFYGGNWEAMR